MEPVIPKYSALQQYLTVRTDELLSASVMISPNPAQDRLTIQTGDFFQGNLDLALFDVNGRLIRNWNIDNVDSKFTLVAPSDLQGMYLLRITSEEETLTKRVLFGK